MFKQQQKKLTVLIIILLLIVIFIFFTFVSPAELVTRLGVRNAYILAFLVSLFGGFSAPGSVSFITLLIALVAGGINPFYLGIVSGIALTIGDITLFYIGSKGRELIKGKGDQKLKKLARLFEKKKWLKKLTPILAYIYIGFIPLPNDILLLFLAAVKYPMKKMQPIILLGDITFPLLVSLLASKGIVLFI